jgi:hypothetical protein
VGQNVVRSNHIGRKLIATTPVLLIFGIIAQVILLVIVIILFIPALIWPSILDGFYRWITKSMARIMARNLVGKRSRELSQVTPVELSFRDRDTPGEVPPTGRVPSMVE